MYIVQQHTKDVLFRVSVVAAEQARRQQANRSHCVQPICAGPDWVPRPWSPHSMPCCPSPDQILAHCQSGKAKEGPDARPFLLYINRAAELGSHCSPSWKPRGGARVEMEDPPPESDSSPKHKCGNYFRISLKTIRREGRPAAASFVSNEVKTAIAQPTARWTASDGGLDSTPAWSGPANWGKHGHYSLRLRVLPKVNSGTLCAAKVASTGGKVQRGSAYFSGATPITRTPKDPKDALGRGQLLLLSETTETYSIP